MTPDNYTRPDLTFEQANRVMPVAQAMLEDMTTMLIPEDGVTFDFGALEKATIQRMLDGKLNITTEVPLAFQSVLAGLVGLKAVLGTCTYPEKHTMEDYARVARAMLGILATAQTNLTDVQTASDGLKAVQDKLDALFLAEDMSSRDIKYVMDSIVASFETMRLGAEKSIEESMERAQAKSFGVDSVLDVTLDKLDTFLRA